jgi:hypothetical protein
MGHCHELRVEENSLVTAARAPHKIHLLISLPDTPRNYLRLDTICGCLPPQAARLPSPEVAPACKVHCGQIEVMQLRVFHASKRASQVFPEMASFNLSV